MNYTVRRTILTVAVYLLLFSTADALVLPKTSALIPVQTVFMLDIDNFAQCQSQFKKTDISRLYNDPAMVGFAEDVQQKWQKKVSETNNEILKAITTAGVWPSGRAAFVLVLDEKAQQAKEPTALFITQWGANISKIRDAVDKTVDKAVQDGLGLKADDYRSHTIKTIIAKDAQRLGLGFSSNLSFCFVDDCLIGSEDIDVLKFVIAHIEGASGATLAGDNDFTSSLRTVGPYRDIGVYVNIKHIVKTVLATDVQDKARAMITNLGLDNVAGFAGALGFAAKPSSSCYGKAHLKINGSAKGIFRMLQLVPRPLKAPRFISDDFYSMVFVNLDIKQAHSQLAGILGSFSPMYASMLYMPLIPPGNDGKPGLMLKDDIIDHFGSQIIVAQAIKDASADNISPTESIIALEITNRSAMEKSFSTLHSRLLSANNPDARRELLGHTIYIVDIMSGLNFMKPGKTPMQQIPPAGAAQMPQFAFAFTDSHLIAGTESVVEQSIRTLRSGDSRPLSSAKWFNAAKLNIPSVAGLAALEDSAVSAEFFWNMMKKSAAAGAKDKSEANIGIAASGASAVPHLMFTQSQIFDPSLLPEFETVKKYFGLSTSYGMSNSDGFLFEFDNLRADK